MEAHNACAQRRTGVVNSGGWRDKLTLTGTNSSLLLLRRTVGGFFNCTYLMVNLMRRQQTLLSQSKINFTVQHRWTAYNKKKRSRTYRDVEKTKTNATYADVPLTLKVQFVIFQDLKEETWTCSASSFLVYLRTPVFTLNMKCVVRQLDCPQQASREIWRSIWQLTARKTFVLCVFLCILIHYENQSKVGKHKLFLCTCVKGNGEPDYMQTELSLCKSIYHKLPVDKLPSPCLKQSHSSSLGNTGSLMIFVIFPLSAWATASW